MPTKRGVKNKKTEHPVTKAIIGVHQHFWDHFIPHEGNNHVPHVLKHTVLLGYSVIILLLKVLVVVTPIMLPSASLYSSSITPSNILLLTNQTRSNLGLPGLTQNSKLMAAAQDKAMDMLKNQYFAHFSPDGLSPWYFIKGEGYAYERAGENLAVHYTSAEGVHEGWLASPTHRANMVNDNFTEIGIGVINGEFEGSPSTIVVQMFGRPKGAVVPAQEPVEETKAVVDTNEIIKTFDDAPEKDKINNEDEVVSDTKQVVKEEPVKAVKQAKQMPEEEKKNIMADLSNDVDSNKEVVKASAETPIVDASRLVVTPTDKVGVYEVKIAADKAASVAVQMGPDWVDLEMDPEEKVWKGEVAGLETYNKNGEPMQVIAKDKNGEVTAQTAAIIAPSLSLQDFFIFSEGKSKAIKVFGFLTLNNLDDGVKKFYVYFMIFLAAAVMLKVLVKVHIQRVSIIAHACFVLAFAMVMFMI